MDWRTLIEALALGAIEGLTEFIPVSSTGHLILFAELFGFDGPPGRVFEIVIQLGAILAVCFVYRKRLIDTLLGLGRDVSARRFAFNVFIAFLPAVIAGVLLHGFIKSVLFSPYVVCISLIVGGFLILFIERNFTSDRVPDVDSIDWKLALQIGLCQIVAMIPGVSRSGATIVGAMLMGADKRAAAEFSFFLAMPTMAGAFAYDLLKNHEILTVDDVTAIAVGFAAAFVSALLVVRTLLDYVGRHGYTPFAWWRIVVGSAGLAGLLVYG
jgi:undecaprenyl-diphosphatase